MNVRRVLRWYEKKGDRLVGERVLHELTLDDLRSIFMLDPNDPMYESYPVTWQGRYLMFFAHIDLETYDYFVEAESY